MAEPPLSAEEISHKGFPSTFRGFDPAEVRAYLVRVSGELKAAAARERDMQGRLTEAERRAANPVIDQAMLTRGLGEETSRVLASAQEVAHQLKARAEESVARILREAHEQAQRIRAEAEGVLADRTEEAEAAVSELRRAAQAEAAAIVEQAHQEAEAAREDLADQARQLVHEAQAARARVLGDMARRRRIAHTQVEQLRAGRERLLEAYRVVRRTLDEVSDELQRVEPEAREAAGAAARRAEAALDAAEAEAEAEAKAEAESKAEAEAEDPEIELAADRLRVAELAPAVETPPESPSTVPGPSPVEESASHGEVAARASKPVSQAAPVPREARSAVTPFAVMREEQLEERKLSSLRILRRPRSEARPGAEREVVEAPSEIEGVRIIASSAEPAKPALVASESSAPSVTPGVSWAAPPVPSASPSPSLQGSPAQLPPMPSEQREVEAGPDAEAAGASSPPSSVDALFARLRADQARVVERSDEVLDAADGSGARAAGNPDPTPTADDTGAGPDPSAPEPPPEPGAAGETAAAGPSGGDGDERLLQQRDEVVEAIEANLARKLKRALQDDRNDVLDRLRSWRGAPDPSAFLPAPAEQAARYAEAAGALLLEAARAGARFVSPNADLTAEPGVTDVVLDLTEALVGPLRRAIDRGAEGGQADTAALVDAIGAAYRECRAQRLERLTAEATIAAFSCGTLNVTDGATLRWVVDDGHRACSDCDDNALAGPTSAGEPYPTGQCHPPAHAGCRCLLVPGTAP